MSEQQAHSAAYVWEMVSLATSHIAYSNNCLNPVHKHTSPKIINPPASAESGWGEITVSVTHRLATEVV